MKLLESTENKIAKDKNGENESHLEITEVVLVHNDYLQDSRVLYTFVPKKPFGSLLEISLTNHIFFKKINSKRMKYGLQIKIVNCRNKRQNKFNTSN